MALLAEEVVEEWLNRSGYFTIRGIKLGVDEIDLLAIKPMLDGQLERRHIEVQVSIRPISYITKLPAAIRKEEGKAPHNAKRRDLDLLSAGVEEWVQAKFHKTKKAELKQSLCRGKWTSELVIGNIKYEEEVGLLEQRGVLVHRLARIFEEMISSRGVFKSAGGADLFDLMRLRKLPE